MPANEQQNVLFSPPFATKSGIWTLFRTTWHHSAYADVPEDLDAEVETARLVEQYAAHLRSDPDYRGWLPAEYFDWMKSGRPSTTRTNGWLLLHDVLFSCGFVAWVVLASATLISGIRIACRRRPTAKRPCHMCGYELEGLASSVCPECGGEVPPRKP